MSDSPAPLSLPGQSANPSHSPEPGKCGAKLRAPRVGYCRNWPVTGLARCRMHGKSPQAMRAAERRLAEQRAAASLAEHGVTEVTNPLEAFSALASEAVGLKDYWAARVAAVDEIRFTDAKGAEQLRSEVALYERAMDRAGRLLEAWVKLGIDERMVRIAEGQQRRVAGFLDQAMGLAGVPQELREATVREFARLLRG